MLQWILHLLFPPRCVLCKKLLAKNETDLCRRCRNNTPTYKKSNFRLSFVAGWTGVWYYKDTVRSSIIRYKFHNKSCYAPAYGRILAMKLQNADMTDFDILTFVPISTLRRLHRGYDQVELLANATGKELGVVPLRTLRKIRHTPPQSGIPHEARRRANVLGAYRAVNPENLQGKRILLLDDVVTTGATASECARTLLAAGAKEVCFAALAVTNKNM